MPRWYDVGDDAPVSVTFADSSGTPVDPPEVFLDVISPLGVETTSQYGEPAQTYTIAKPSTGVYTADIDVTDYGVWAYRFRAPDAPGKGVAERIFVARRSAFA